MQYAIELFFDEATEHQLTALTHAVADEGISSRFLQWKSRPHLTLACFNDVDEADCIPKLQAFAKCHPAIPAYLGSVGMFTDTRVIFATPVMQQGMYQLQRELHQALTGMDTKGWEWYLPDRWVPHCTLAQTECDTNFYQASQLVLERFRKTAGQFTAIGLVKVTCPVEERFTVPLG